MSRQYAARMDWARLAVDLIDSLKWPAVVVFVLVAYRGNVSGLFDRLNELGGCGFNTKFEKQIEKAKDELERPTVDEGVVGPSVLIPDGSSEVVAVTVKEFNDIKKIKPFLWLARPSKYGLRTPQT